MTQAVAAYDRYVAGFEALAPERAQQPEWLREMRRAAIEHFRRVGLPTARKGNEPWKYTNVAPIAAREFPAARPAPAPAPGAITPAAPLDSGWRTVVFVDGRYAPALSADGFAGAGAIVLTLPEALESRPQALQEHLVRYVPADYDGFTALNTAFFSDCAFVEIPEGAELSAPLHILHLRTQPRAAAYPRTLVLAGRGSRAEIIETYASLVPADERYFTDAVTEIVLAEEAEVRHYRLLLEAGGYHIGVSRVQQLAGSRFTSVSFSTGPLLGRNDFAVVLDAPGAECYLRGLYVAAGDQHIDNYLSIDHAKPQCTSRLYYKGILDERARAVFGGTVFVRRGADKTDAHQEDKNLVLSPEAEVDSKPALEIYADDVKAGHGATAGAAAEDAVFYMRSRGLDEEMAQIFLIKGFASEILDEVTVAPLRAYLEERTARALPRFHRDVSATFHLLDPDSEGAS